MTDTTDLSPNTIDSNLPHKTNDTLTERVRALMMQREAESIVLRVVKRQEAYNREAQTFDAQKIASALSKAFLAVRGDQAHNAQYLPEVIVLLTQRIIDNIESLSDSEHVSVESIQDLVVRVLMEDARYHDVAESYIIYRNERKKKREALRSQTKTVELRAPNGDLLTLDMSRLSINLAMLCSDLKDVNLLEVVDQSTTNLYAEAPVADAYQALIMSARAMIESEPAYSFVASRILQRQLFEEAASVLGKKVPGFLFDVLDASEIPYKKIFKVYCKKGIDAGLLNPEVIESFDLDILAKAMKPERDASFHYLAMQTLYDRYFLHDQDQRFELPQLFFMRVAMGLSWQEPKQREATAIHFYEALSTFHFMSSTPTLFNTASPRSQLSSCFLTTISDDLDGIYSALRDNALLSKFAGGLGNDWTPVRASGAHIKGTNGRSSGIVPFLNVADATAIAVNQGGKRKGAVCAYLELWHADIESFLELRKNTGDERRRTHDMNTACWIPDLFMKRMDSDDLWTLFSPDVVPDLHDLYGEAFEQAYVAYETQALKGNISYRQIKAKHLWRKMISMVFETGHPWMTFKDPCNIRSPQRHKGRVHSSNLCTEITLNTSEKEIAVCNLGSVNLPLHIKDGVLDRDQLRQTVHTAIRMLDNVIDINYYAVPQAEHSNRQHRPIGLGMMGFQDALYLLGIPYASNEAVVFADQSMEMISYYAIEASALLAKERGAYPSYAGSLWDQGILPIDSIKLLAETRQSAHCVQDTSMSLDWQPVRDLVKQHGMRHSNVMAIAPTATIANICGVTQSIEPTYQNLFVKSNLSGEFTIVNPYLVAALKERGLWDEAMANDLKYYNGSVDSIDRIPDDIKSLYATAFEVDSKWLIEAGSRRQKWIDQSQSLNLYIAKPSGKKMHEMYWMAWVYGLKTTYYCRSKGATTVEKSTVKDGALNAVGMQSTAEDEGSCESCQ
jgi:ribonucleoside-diphosphate reductase alpha chain